LIYQNTQFIRQNSERLFNETEPAGILPKLRVMPCMRGALVNPIEKLDLMEKPGHWAELPHALQDRDSLA
jgi:hypothetical protein